MISPYALYSWLWRLSAATLAHNAFFFFAHDVYILDWKGYVSSSWWHFSSSAHRVENILDVASYFQAFSKRKTCYKGEQKHHHPPHYSNSTSSGFSGRGLQPKSWFVDLLFSIHGAVVAVRTIWKWGNENYRLVSFTMFSCLFTTSRSTAITSSTKFLFFNPNDGSPQKIRLSCGTPCNRWMRKSQPFLPILRAKASS